MSFITRITKVFSPLIIKSGWSSLDACDVLITRHDADCGYQYHEAAYSPIADSVVEICIAEGLSVLSIATPLSQLVGKRAFNRPIAFNRSFTLIAILSRILASIYGSSRAKDWAKAKKARIWLRVLAIAKPRLVIGIQPDLSLCRACRLLGIPVYDFQHGIIASDHWWYGGELKNNVAHSDLPSGFLCWDSKSAQPLAKWAPAKGAAVEVVGHPWFHRFLFPKQSDQLVQEVLNQAQIFLDDKPTLLVSLQWGLHTHDYKECNSNRIMCDALVEVIKKTQIRYNWLLRLHPVQLRGAEGEFCNTYLLSEFGKFSSVNWDKASSLPLPVILSQIDLHITDHSSVVTEAAWAGVPSAMLNPYLNKGQKHEGLFEEERRSGLAIILSQETMTIESWIEASLSSSEGRYSPTLPENGIRPLLELITSTRQKP